MQWIQFIQNLSTGGYVIEGSAGFADAGANHHNWSPAGTGDSRTVMTLEVLFKLFSLATDQHIFAASDGAGNNIERLYIDATGNLHYKILVSGATAVHYETTAQFRDYNAWYQVVVIRNGNTVTIYVNGTVVTAFDTSNAPTGDNGMFGYTEAHYIGRKPWATSGYLDLAISRLTYQDGVAASISDYGETVGSGWRIADASGLSLGTNGVQITGGTDMAAGTLTRSGTAHSVTKTGTITATNDSPTDDAENGYGNYCVWDPLFIASDGGTPASKLSDGNLVFTEDTGAIPQFTHGTILVPETGVWQFEVQLTTLGPAPRNNYFGFVDLDRGLNLNTGVTSRAAEATNTYGKQVLDGVDQAGSYTKWNDGAVLGMVFDRDADEVKCYVDGSLEWTLSSASTYLTGRTAVSGYHTDTGTASTTDFGQKGFQYPISGALALCTANLPAPTPAASATPITGSFTGNAAVPGPNVWLGYTPDTGGTSTINGNTITWGTHARPTASGFTIITSSASYNASGSNTYSIAVEAPFGGVGVEQARAR